MNFYISFGQAHPLKNGLVKIVAENGQDARAAAVEHFGKWSMIYPEEDLTAKEISEYFPAGIVQTIEV